jgi:putative membrane protein
MRILLKIIVGAIAVFLASQLVSGIEVESWKAALFASIALSIINLIVRPVIKVLTLPITILTLGLFSFVINTFMFWMASFFVDGFEVEGFVAAFLGALIMTMANWILGWFAD